MATPRQTYIDRYAATVAAAQRWQDIRRDVQAEQDQAQYLRSLISAERQFIQQMQAGLVLDEASAQKLSSIDQARAGIVGTRAGLGRLDEKEKSRLNAVLRKTRSEPEAGRDELLGLFSGYSKEEAAEALREVEAASGTVLALDENMMAAVRRAAAGRPAAAGYGAKREGELQKARGAVLDVAGQKAEQRAEIEAAIEAAKEQVARLTDELAKSPASRYSDPAREATKRELIARGYKFSEGAEEWKNEFLPYQNTPWYTPILSAQEKVRKARETATPLSPSTKGERLAATLLFQAQSNGTKMDLPTLDKQLRKAKSLTDKEREDALSFILAYTELGGTEQDPAQLKLQAQEQQRREKEEARQRLLAEEGRKEIEDLTRFIEEQNASLQRDVKALRESQQAQEAPSRAYARYRARGMSEEEARAKALEAAPPPRTGEVSRIVVSPESVIERQQRPFQDISSLDLKGALLEKEAPPAPAAPALAPGDEGFEFVDESDPAKPRYRRTRTGYEAISGPNVGLQVDLGSRGGAALEAAEQGDWETVARMNQPRRAARPAAAAAPAGASEAPAPVAEPPPKKKRLVWNPATGTFVPE